MRIFYTFAPRRCAILLTGGNKAGDGRFCERMIPMADRLSEEYLREVGKDPMTGHRSFAALRERMSPTRRARNLRRYIEALGGTLEITAQLPDGEVTTTNFRDVEQRYTAGASNQSSIALFSSRG